MTSMLSIYFYNMGLAQLKGNSLSTAMEYLKKAVYWQPENQTAWDLLGLCYYRAGRIPMARYCWMYSTYYLYLLGNEGVDTVNCLKKAQELAEQREYKASLQCLKDNGVNSPQLLIYMGILEYLSKNKEQAKAYWLSAAELDKSDERPIRYLEYMERRAGGLFNKIKKEWSALYKRFGRKASK